MASQAEQHLAPSHDQDFDMLSDSGRHDNDIDIDFDIADPVDDHENDTPIVDAPDMDQNFDVGLDDDVMQEEVEGVVIEETMLDGDEEQLVDEQMDDSQQGGVALDAQDVLVDLDFELEPEVVNEAPAPEVTFDDATEEIEGVDLDSGALAAADGNIEDASATEPLDVKSVQADAADLDQPTEGPEEVQPDSHDDNTHEDGDSAADLLQASLDAEDEEGEEAVNDPSLDTSAEAFPTEGVPAELEADASKPEGDSTGEHEAEENDDSVHVEHDGHEDNEEEYHEEEEYSSVSYAAVVHYQGQVLSLFPPPEGQLPATFLLHDAAFAGQSLPELFAACRSVLGETVDDDHSIVIEVPDMDLVLSEDDSNCPHVTIAQVFDVYHRLHYNDEVYEPAPLKLTLDLKMRLPSQLALLFSTADAGQGFQSLKPDEHVVEEEGTTFDDTQHDEAADEGEHDEDVLEETSANVEEALDEENVAEAYDVSEIHNEAGEQALLGELTHDDPQQSEDYIEAVHEEEQEEKHGEEDIQTSAAIEVQDDKVGHDEQAQQDPDDLIDYSDDEDEVVPTHTATTRSSTVQPNTPDKENNVSTIGGKTETQSDTTKAVQANESEHVNHSEQKSHTATAASADATTEEAGTSAKPSDEDSADANDEITWDDEPREDVPVQASAAATSTSAQATPKEDDFSIYSDDENDYETKSAAKVKAELSPPSKRTWSEHAEGQASEANEQDFKKVKSN